MKRLVNFSLILSSLASPELNRYRHSPSLHQQIEDPICGVPNSHKVTCSDLSYQRIPTICSGMKRAKTLCTTPISDRSKIYYTSVCAKYINYCIPGCVCDPGFKFDSEDQKCISVEICRKRLLTAGFLGLRSGKVNSTIFTTAKLRNGNGECTDPNTINNQCTNKQNKDNQDMDPTCFAYFKKLSFCKVFHSEMPANLIPLCKGKMGKGCHNGCTCKEDYLIEDTSSSSNLGKCVAKSECAMFDNSNGAARKPNSSNNIIPTCKDPNTTYIKDFKECNRVSCSDVTKEGVIISKNCLNSETTSQDNCICDQTRGFVQTTDTDKTCIQAISCPQVELTCDASKNEMKSNCANCKPKVCDINESNLTSNCTCRPGCVCKEGYVVYKGHCITTSACSSALYDCFKNEENFVVCDNTCKENTCSDLTIPGINSGECEKNNCFSGCKCKKGFFRESNDPNNTGKCVRATNCSSDMKCSSNQIFSRCSNESACGADGKPIKSAKGGIGVKIPASVQAMLDAMAKDKEKENLGRSGNGEEEHDPNECKGQYKCICTYGYYNVNGQCQTTCTAKEDRKCRIKDGVTLPTKIGKNIIHANDIEAVCKTVGNRVELLPIAKFVAKGKTKYYCTRGLNNYEHIPSTVVGAQSTKAFKKVVNCATLRNHWKTKNCDELGVHECTKGDVCKGCFKTGKTKLTKIERTPKFVIRKNQGVCIMPRGAEKTGLTCKACKTAVSKLLNSKQDRAYFIQSKRIEIQCPNDKKNNGKKWGKKKKWKG